MATRFAAERYCVQSNNGNAKSTTSKAFTKFKIKGLPKCIGIKDGALAVKGTTGVTKSSWKNSKMSKDHQYNINHQQNIEEIQSIMQSNHWQIT